MNPSHEIFQLIYRKEYTLPSSSLHNLSDIILDLIRFAAVYLRLNGRLVFWLPVYAPRFVFIVSCIFILHIHINIYIYIYIYIYI